MIVSENGSTTYYSSNNYTAEEFEGIKASHGVGNKSTGDIDDDEEAVPAFSSIKDAQLNKTGNADFSKNSGADAPCPIRDPMFPSYTLNYRRGDVNDYYYKKAKMALAGKDAQISLDVISTYVLNYEGPLTGDEIEALYNVNSYNGSNVTKQQMLDIGWSKSVVTDDMVLDLNRVLAKYGINTPEKIAMFIATATVETGWGKDLVQIGGALVVNGVDYRGGGYTQLTGFNNYKAFAEQMLKEGQVRLDSNGNNPIMSGGAQYVADNFAWEAGGWHWNAPGNNINKRIDNGASFYKVSQVINGGPNYSGTPNGWVDREKAYERAMQVFEVGR